MAIGPEELIIILLIILLLFGAKKLPELGRALGDAVREFKKGLGGEKQEEKKKKK
jgi:sec-independent protein translocase protein TatA